jgi:hypothetical protein
MLLLATISALFRSLSSIRPLQRPKIDLLHFQERHSLGNCSMPMMFPSGSLNHATLKPVSSPYTPPLCFQVGEVVFLEGNTPISEIGHHIIEISRRGKLRPELSGVECCRS